MTEGLEIFSLGQVLTITTGKILCSASEAKEILSYMTNDTIYTHQMSRALRECQPELLKQHPQLRDIVVPQLNSRDEYLEWLYELSEIHGKDLVVEPLMVHVHKDSVEELKEMAPHMMIEIIDVDKECLR